MGTRYILTLDCYYCNGSNDVYYTDEFGDFRCVSCGKLNSVRISFSAWPGEDELADVPTDKERREFVTGLDG